MSDASNYLLAAFFAVSTAVVVGLAVDESINDNPMEKRYAVLKEQFCAANEPPTINEMLAAQAVGGIDQPEITTELLIGEGLSEECVYTSLNEVNLNFD